MKFVWEVTDIKAGRMAVAGGGRAFIIIAANPAQIELGLVDVESGLLVQGKMLGQLDVVAALNDLGAVPDEYLEQQEPAIGGAVHVGSFSLQDLIGGGERGEAVLPEGLKKAFEKMLLNAGRPGSIG